MENRLGNSNGVGIPKKSRSLDLKTLYKSSIPKDSVNKSLKRKSRSGDSDDQQKQDKKGRKVVSLSSLEKFDVENGKSLEKACNGDSILHDLEDSKVGLGEKLCDSSRFQGISLGLGGSLIYVPRRRRGFVGRSRFENSQAQKPAGESLDQVELVDQIPKVAAEESSAHDQLSKAKEKGSDSSKEVKESDPTFQQNLENGHSSESAVKDGQLAYQGTHSNSRKRKSLATDNRSVEEEAKPSGATCNRISEVSREDDEENLEANAARMLCSRFDPSCTGFSSNTPVPPSANRLRPLSSSAKNSAVPRSKLSNAKCSLVDTDDRMLRPRRNQDEKGTGRKRRHFYEILFSDVDSNWLLNKRIKVFWPLDESWYHGLVDDYDKERKLHHVKYDDRDEEWINLQVERFKILLLPAEVPVKNQRKRHRAGPKSSKKIKGNASASKGEEKRSSRIEDDSCMGNMESEPIITWLARSAHRFKSSTLHAIKKRRKFAALPSNETEKPGGPVVGDTEGQDTSKSACSLSSSILAGWSRNESATKTPSCPKRSKLPIVYFRRRFHSTKKGMSRGLENNNLEVLKQQHVPKCLDPDVEFWPSDDSGVSELYFPWNNSKQFGLSLSIPVVLLMSSSLVVDAVWLSHVVLLLHHGAVVTMWPRVRLEILFLNNQVGLRYLFFEGCLMEAVPLIFRVLTVFHQSDEQGRHADLQLPVSSIGFRLSCIPGRQRHLAFAFCSFCEVKNSEWAYLEQNVKRHSLLTKQLPLSECTYDNIKALQRGQVPDPSVSDNSLLAEGIQKRSRHVISPGHVYRESSCHKAWKSSISIKKQYFGPPFALSFTAPPTFFLSLHQKMLMENSNPDIDSVGHDSADCLDTCGNLVIDDCSDMEDCTGKKSESSSEGRMGTLQEDAACHEYLCPSNLERIDDFSMSGIGSEIGVLEKAQNDGSNSASLSPQDLQETKDVANQSQRQQQQQSESENCTSFGSPADRNETETRPDLPVNGISIQVPVCDHCEDSGDTELRGTQQSSDLAFNIQGSIIPSPNPTAPRSACHRSRSSLSFGYLSHGWSDAKGGFLHGNFGNGPKKPRTQVSYSLPSGVSDSRNKGHLQKGLPHKRIRRSNDRKSADVSRGPQKDLETTSCDANLLVTLGDRGWRECGARVVLEPFDDNEWKLAVKISGTTRYSYRAYQFLQPGSTNRFTHAMMWKGGKDWILEFPDRSQWSLFKEMHEECYNRNIRAASVRNIPIPGVRMIEKNNDNGTEAAFTRASKYFRQTETDVEMALDPSRVLYDMDSDDEQCLLRIHGLEAENGGVCEINEDVFEKAMDMFEKAAYVQQRDQFTLNEIDELMVGTGPMEAMKRIYEHWWAKRQRKGMPLIRHLQPPLWEKYQRELKDWELAMTKANMPFSIGSQEKGEPVEKPAMFAFCLKPRGLEVPHKGSKHRSQKKLSVYAQHAGDHDGLNSSGRRLSGLASGDERFLYSNHSYEYLDESPLHQVLPGVFSPRDSGIGYFSMSGNGYYRNHQNKFQRNNSKKPGAFASSSDAYTAPLYSHRINGKRNRIDRWNASYSEWPSPHLYYSTVSRRLNLEDLNSTDIDEFKLRDAATAAKRARDVAKLKRERAERLSYRADLAIQKAAAALMCAEAIKASSTDPSER